MTSGFDGIGWHAVAGAPIGARWPLPNPEGLAPGDERWLTDIREGVAHLVNERSAWLVVLPLGRSADVPSDLAPSTLASLDRSELESMPWVGHGTGSWLRLLGTSCTCRLLGREGRKEEWIVATEPPEGEGVVGRRYDVSFVVVVDESSPVDGSASIEEQDRDLAVVVLQFHQDLHDNRGIVPQRWERLVDGLDRLVVVQRTRDTITSSLAASLLLLEPAMLMAATSPRSPVPEEEMLERWAEVNRLLLAAFPDTVELPGD